MFKKMKSVKSRIVLLVTCGIVFSALFLAWAMIPSIKRNLQNEKQRYMEDVAKMAGDNMETALHSLGWEYFETKASFGDALSKVQLKDMESSFAYMISVKDGNVVYSLREAAIGKPVQNAKLEEIVTRLQAGENVQSGYVESSFSGTDICTAYFVSADKSFVIAIVCDEDEILASMNTLVLRMFWASAICVVVLTIIGFFVSSEIARPLKKLTRRINKIAELDFTEDSIELDIRRDEIGEISKAITQVHDELVTIVTDLKNQGEQLATSNHEFNEQFDSISETVDNVNIAVEEIAQGSTSQAQETSNAANQVVGIGTAIDANVESIKVLENSVNKMSDLAQAVQGVLQGLVSINNKTSNNITEVNQKTIQTNDSAIKINEAVKLIQNIAEQTNLLSLNASIEAARAGEAGSGFAVVASEIRNLSESSANSALTISEIVQELFKNSNESVEKMSEVATDAKDERGKLQDTIDSFEELKKEVDSVDSASKDLLVQTEKLNKLKEGVSVVVEQLAAISEENAASTEETLASMQTLSSTIGNCKDETVKLTNLSQSLNDATDKFKL